MVPNQPLSHPAPGANPRTMTQSQREPQAMLTGIFVRAEINGEWKAVDLASPELPIDAALAWLKEQDGPTRWRLAHALMQVMQEQDSDSGDVAEAMARLMIFYVRIDVGLEPTDEGIAAPQ